MKQSDALKLAKIQEEATNVSFETLKLPMPRRFALDVSQDFFKTYLGDALTVIDDLLREDLSSGEIYRAIRQYPKLKEEILDERGVSREAFEGMLIMRRFYLNKGHVFTYRESLCRRLDDMDIGSKVPMSFMKPPFPTVFVEFGQAESRGNLPYKVFADNKAYVLEGVYVTYRAESERSILSPEGERILGIEKDKPLRCLEMSFPGSPISAPENNQAVFHDFSAYLSLVWTDDDQTIEETLQRQFDLIDRRGGESKEMKDSLKENVRRLAKALLYLITGNREQQEEKPEGELSKRLEALKNPAKARKVHKQLMRVYDRVVIGPDKPYIPLEERLQGIKKRTGVRPHFRRAHWSTRWSGKGKKILRPVQIDMTLVNSEGLSDDDVMMLHKDYDVR